MLDSEIWWSFFRLLISLPLVLALAYFILRYGGRRRTLPGCRRRMRLMEQLPLGPKSFLSLVEVGGRYYLLAQQENSVVLVKEFNSLPEVIEEANLDARWRGRFKVLLEDRLAKSYGKARTEGEEQRDE